MFHGWSQMQHLPKFMIAPVYVYLPSLILIQTGLCCIYRLQNNCMRHLLLLVLVKKSFPYTRLTSRYDERYSNFYLRIDQAENLHLLSDKKTTSICIKVHIISNHIISYQTISSFTQEIPNTLLLFGPCLFVCLCFCIVLLCRCTVC